jgi:serine/threonine protein phosphatase PrpC
MRVVSAFRAAGHSHPGLQRSENEDRFHYDPARGIFIVVDGVGGHAAGEQAADTAIAMLRARLERETGPVGDRVREAIAIANNEIHRRASLRPEWKGMACVLTVAVIDEASAIVGHVGDTRLYKLRRGQIDKVTRDHSPVGEREDARELSEAQAMRHPRRNEVYRDVGSDPHEPSDPEFIDLLHVPFEPDAALLLCSDGLTDAISSATIADIVDEYAGHPYEIVRALVNAANEAGGKDNVTVVYVEGPQFAAAVNRPAVSLARRDPPVSVPVIEPDTRRRAGAGAAKRWRRGLLIVLLLAVAGAGAWRLGVRWPAGWWRPPVSSLFSFRTITVAATESLAAAIERASPGTEVIVEPGEYRERLRLKSGVRVRSRVPRGAAVRLPSGASETDAAILAADVVDAELSGFRIVGDAATPLGVGVFVRNAGVVLSDIEITGAQLTAIEFAGGGDAVLLAADVRDNPGAGLTVRAGAAPRIAHNSFLRNGRSEQVSGGIVIDAGARPQLVSNVFRCLAADSLTALTPAERGALQSANVFIACEDGASRGPATLRGPQGRPEPGRGATGSGRRRP